MTFGAFRLIAVLLGLVTSETAVANKPSSASSLFGASINTRVTLQPKQVDLPALDTISEVEVGESVISKERSIAVKSVKFSAPITGSVGVLFVKNIISFASTTVPLLGTISGGSLYANPKDTIPQGAGTFSSFYVPDNPDDPHYICSATLKNTVLCEPIAAKAGVTYTVIEANEPTADSFKRELVYTGGSSKSITLIYREFLNDYARPAFTQELKYDISEDRVIGFRGARLEVINSGNSGLKYKVIRHLQ